MLYLIRLDSILNQLVNLASCVDLNGLATDLMYSVRVFVFMSIKSLSLQQGLQRERIQVSRA